LETGEMTLDVYARLTIRFRDADHGLTAGFAR